MPTAIKKVTAKKSAAKKSVPGAAKASEKTRSYMSQEDIPAFSIDEALVVAEVIFAEYGGGPSTPLDASAYTQSPALPPARNARKVLVAT